LEIILVMIVVPIGGQTERTLILTADHGDGEQRGLLDEHLIK
jgi:phage gp45-like